MAFNFSVPASKDSMKFQIEAGETMIFVGANGGGKTRLSAYIENALEGAAHRISANRGIRLDPSIEKVSQNKALSGLRTGHAEIGGTGHIVNRRGSRWAGEEVTHQLEDFHFVIQALFADQAAVALQVYKQVNVETRLHEGPVKPTKFKVLGAIWSRLLPRRKLCITEDDILVSISKPEEGAFANGLKDYSAKEMSDGERSVFYMIGQALVATQNSVLIIDEPELHMHRSIMSPLWDEIEAARPDCGFVYITHDLEFAASRAAQKFVIKSYAQKLDAEKRPKLMQAWEIVSVPKDSDFDEELTTLILGSRKPVLFVEGKGNSLDLPIYRACYPDWSIVCRNSCTEVIHAVATMRANADLTRITCAGIVDLDGRDENDRGYLKKRGIFTLPVSEIENLFLLPDVSRAIASAEGHQGEGLEKILDELAHAVFESLNTPEKIQRVVVDHCRRRIDQALKRIDLQEMKTIESLQERYTDETRLLNITSMAQSRTEEIENAIKARNLKALLALVDDKGLLHLAASNLKNCRLDSFSGWITRSVRNGSCPGLSEALSACLPKIEVP